MIVLALDTALAATQVAIFDAAANAVRASARQDMTTGHAEALIPLIEASLGEAGIAYDALGRIVTTIGPGSFTGVRIALSAARALGLALQIPVVGVTTLEALAAEAPAGETPLAAVIDARRGDVYVQHFAGEGAPLGPPALRGLAQAAAELPHSARLIGTGAPLLAALREGVRAVGAPTAPDIAEIARIGAARALPHHPPAPLYLRAPDAKPQGAPLARRA